MVTWYWTKIVVPSGIYMIHALGDNVPEGEFDWGKVERIRKLTEEEVEQLHRAETELMKAWAKTLPSELEM